jgi:hypothetical protein
MHHQLLTRMVAMITSCWESGEKYIGRLAY